VLLPHMVCIALVVGGLVVGGQVEGSRLCVRDEGSCSKQAMRLG